MSNRDDKEQLQASQRQRSTLKKYAKVARTSMLAVTMGMNWQIAQAAAGGPDTNGSEQQTTLSVQSPSPYTGNSLDYFRNQFLPQSSYRMAAEGEHAPTAINVHIAGIAMAGKTLQGSYQYEDADGNAENGTLFQWYRSDDSAQAVNFTAIPNATGITYTLTSADVGKYITFVVTPRTDVAPTDGIAARSEATAPIAAQPVGAYASHTEEESLIEVVAVQQNKETGNSAKLKLTKDTDGIALAAFHFLTDGVVQSSQNASPKETVAVRVGSLIGARTVTADIAGDAIAALQAKQQRLAVLTGDVAIEFPSWSIPVDAVSKSGGLSADRVQLNIRIEKQPASVKSAANEWAAGRGASVIGEPYKFSMQIGGGTDGEPVVQYGNVYAYQTIPIPDGVANLNALGAVMLLDGKYVSVPVRIVDGSHALIHAPTNATLMLIQRDERFADTDNHWSVDDVLLMADKGNTAGDAQGRYNPNAPITRAEFAELLVSALGLGHQETKDGVSFTDLPADEAAQLSILIAAKDGLLPGTADGAFSPDAPIAREQIISVLMRCFREYQLAADPAKTKSGAPGFKDFGLTSDSVVSDVRDAYETGIITGYEDGTLRPQQSGTRAEAAALIRRFLQVTGLIN